MKPEHEALLRERLSAKSERVGQCLFWRGHSLPTGYGVLRVRPIRTAQFYAHRVSWELANGQEVPLGMFVCHRCDNPSCIEPTHLFVGTPKDNNADMYSKGRGPVGERHGSARLSASDVAAIRASSESARSLARKYGVSDTTIGRARRGDCWSEQRRGRPKQYAVEVAVE